MPSVFTHPAVPLVLSLGLGREVVSSRLLICGIIASALPDLDVLAFPLGISYSSQFGHRGFSHSLLFAVVAGLAGGCFFRWLRSTFSRCFLFLSVSIASHGLLDAFTNGGLGVALLWPWSDHRYFAPFRVIEVSPIGVATFFSERGLLVLKSEFLWIWLPAIVAGVVMLLIRRALSR